MERIVRSEFNESTQQWITKDYIEQKYHKRMNKKKFRKIFDDLLFVYMSLTGSEPRVLSYILLHCNKLNQINITYKQLSRKTNLSFQRTKEVMSKLQKLNVIKNNNGNITINPFMFVKDGKQEDILQAEYMPIFNKELQ